MVHAKHTLTFQCYKLAFLMPENEDDQFVQDFNVALAKDTRFEAFVVAVGDGFAVGVRK